MRFYFLEDHGTEAATKAAAALHADIGSVESLRYPNDELHSRVSLPSADEHCVLVGTTAPPDRRLLELLLAADTLKKEGAAKVTALIPYLGYARHDKAAAGDSLATALVGKLVVAAGIDEIVTFELHSERDRKMIPVPIAALSATKLFADVVRREGLSDATFVAPDNGAIERCERVRREAGAEMEIVSLPKSRHEGGIKREEFYGAVGRRAILVDDMLDTGETLVSACEILKAAGTSEIIIMVTHGLFTGERWPRLKDLGVKRIYCTDTTPLPEKARRDWITVLSVAPLIVEYFSSKK